MDGLKSVTNQLNKSKINKSPKITSLSNLSDNIKNNTLLAVNTLIKRFLANVMNSKNPIKIHDTKELRDVISVFQQVEEISGGANDNTPQINTEAVNFITKQFKEPSNSKGSQNSINKKLPNLDEKQVKQLFYNQEHQIDKNNLKKY